MKTKVEELCLKEEQATVINDCSVKANITLLKIAEVSFN